MMSEKYIAEQCLKGNNAARAELYQAFAPRLMALCTRYASGREEAEDMLHDAFLRIFSRMDAFRWKGEGSLRVWLEQVTRSTAIDNLRKAGALSFVPLDRVVNEPMDEPSADDVNALDRNDLLRLIGELPAGYRAVINLYCIDGLTHKEIARLLGIKERTSASQLTRAKALLASRIKERVLEMEDGKMKMEDNEYGLRENV